MNTRYQPVPIDTSDIQLTPSLQPLLEQLARNTHDIWARQRLDEGWTYGPERNERLRQHNCLVPYEQLPESEKQYDRATSQEALRLILKLGYQILPPSQSDLTNVHEQQLQGIWDTLRTQRQNLSSLIQLWQSHEPELWQLHPELYVLLGSEFLKRGEPLLAYDVFSQALSQLPASDLMTAEHKAVFTRLCQQQALALAETGAVNEAARILRQLLRHSDELSPETLGLLGRTYKEMAQGSDLPATKKGYLKKAFKSYHQAYQQAESNGDWDFAYYTGINAASVALMSGQKAQSRALATAVASLCRKLLHEQAECDAPYWLHASLGEAEVLCGHPDHAESAYSAAVKACSSDQRALMSMRRQLLWLSEALDFSTEALLKLFPVPTIVIFSGHRVDEPNAEPLRFPATNEAAIRKAINKWLEQFDHVIAYCSAANGSDLIFIEQVLARSGEVNIILPFDQDSFLRTSVTTDSGKRWAQRFQSALSQATRTVTLAEYHPDVTPQAFDFANLNILGMAQARAEGTGYHLRALTVWNGAVANSAGGTYSAIQHWHRARLPIDHIHSLALTTRSAVLQPDDRPPLQLTELPHGVNYYNYLPMLFADVKGYSKLNELQLVAFSTQFLKCLKEVFDQFRDSIFTRRTQGDGLFVVFRELSAAAAFALAINRTITANDWGALGLPQDLQIRISLDAGPCFTYPEPIMGSTEFCGHYVNRAARLEPITPPGHIYASETFVALAQANNLHHIHFVYAGQVVLPKGHGIIPAYHLQETAE